MAMVKFFDERNFIDWRANNAFIGLIPKRDSVEDVKDFRPISLINTSYKIITHVLSNRLKRVLPKLISYSQTAFMAERQIIDIILMANECINSRIKEDKSGGCLNWMWKKHSTRSVGFS